jgi:hypothetical protein
MFYFVDFCQTSVKHYFAYHLKNHAKKLTILVLVQSYLINLCTVML